MASFVSFGKCSVLFSSSFSFAWYSSRLTFNCPVE
ncbi:hypothetical protein SAMD00023519_00158 [Listeria monocytogenes]|nr:hypothetical protein SAMD00023519_00158 [Listeria monocytogenes]